jgi:hypothetical protein
MPPCARSHVSVSFVVFTWFVSNGCVSNESTRTPYLSVGFAQQQPSTGGRMVVIQARGGTALQIESRRGHHELGSLSASASCLPVPYSGVVFLTEYPDAEESTLTVSLLDDGQRRSPQLPRGSVLPAIAHCAEQTPADAAVSDLDGGRGGLADGGDIAQPDAAASSSERLACAVCATGTARASAILVVSRTTLPADRPAIMFLPDDTPSLDAGPSQEAEPEAAVADVGEDGAVDMDDAGENTSLVDAAECEAGLTDACASQRVEDNS